MPTASKERDLVHQHVYRCGRCAKPFWVSEAGLDREVSCPWCGRGQFVWQESVTGPFGRGRS